MEELLAEESRDEGGAYDVLLLTTADDPRTIRLRAPVVNDTVTQSGKPWDWTLSQRYKLTSRVTHTRQH
jgi:hypothetical protein